MDFKNNEAMVNMALCYRNLSNHTEALALFNKALINSPHDSEILNNIGLIFYDTGKYEEAVQSYLKSLDEKKDGIFLTKMRKSSIIWGWP